MLIKIDGDKGYIRPTIPENSIHFLPPMNAKIATKLSENNIKFIDEITDRALFNKKTQKYLGAGPWNTNRRQNCTEPILNKIKFPVYYFDYETSGGFLLWDGTRPYQQIPFLGYSLHIQKEQGSETEQEYLHRNTNPMPKLRRLGKI